MDLGLASRVALVTGASKGIGRAIAAELAAEGARVAITGRDETALREATDGFAGGPHLGVVHDTADLDALPALVQRVADELGPVDVYVANTGGPAVAEDPLSFTREQWEHAHRVLVLATTETIGLVLPGMRERGVGRVLQVASMAVVEPIPELQLSNAHRPGMVAAFKVLARREARHGVTFNTLHPGRIATARVTATGGTDASDIPAGRLGDPAELAAAAAFLASTRASYVTGQALLVDGGLVRAV